MDFLPWLSVDNPKSERNSAVKHEDLRRSGHRQSGALITGHEP